MLLFSRQIDYQPQILAGARMSQIDGDQSRPAVLQTSGPAKKRRRRTLPAANALNYLANPPSRIIASVPCDTQLAMKTCSISVVASFMPAAWSRMFCYVITISCVSGRARSAGQDRGTVSFLETGPSQVWRTFRPRRRSRPRLLPSQAPRWWVHLPGTGAAKGRCTARLRRSAAGPPWDVPMLPVGSRTYSSRTL